MTMKRPYQIAGGVFILLAAFLGWESLELKFYTYLGPGPGFFPLWLSLALGALAILMVLQATVRRPDPIPADFFASRAGYLRVGAIVAALAAATGLMNLLGFQLTMLGIILFLLLALGRPSWPVTLLVSVAGSFGCFYLFNQFLKVPLPTGFFGF